MRWGLPSALAGLLVAVTVAPVDAQAPAGDSWRVNLTPYLVGASMGGTTTVKGQETTVDLSASDIFSHLKFGAMVLVAARKGDWGIGGDGVGLALRASAAPGPSVSADVDVKEGLFAVYGLRRLAPVADLTFGGRVNVLRGSVRISGPVADHTADERKTWLDPLVGLLLHTPDGGKRWHASVYTEIGGFGIGSTFTWQIFPTFGVNLSKAVSLDFGYRWLDVDYTTGEADTLFKWDVLAQGPVVGCAIRF